MINIKTETDSIDGKSLERQLSILLTHFIVLIASFFLIIGFEWIILSIAGYSEKAGYYINNILPITLLFWGGTWILLAPFGFINPKGNRIQATHNPFSPAYLTEGGTQFIVYQTGFALKYLWEELQGEEIAIEKENLLEGDSTTVSIKKIALETKVSTLWKVHLLRLSSFLQNKVEKNGMDGVLTQMKAASNQYIEECASKYDDTEKVREDQTTILNNMLERIRPQALRFGLDFLQANFSKCDYSSDTQKELNKVLEARVLKDIADEMDLSEDGGRKYELAALAANKPGAKITRTIFEVVMTPEVAEVAKAAGPAAAALFAAQQAKGNK